MIKTIKSFGKSGRYIEYKPVGEIKGIILYFHGLGEVGKGIDAIETNELPKLIKQGLDIPYIVVAPYLPSGNSWTAATIKSMFKVLDSYGLDEKHVTGLSLGGIATISAVNLAYGVYGYQGYFKTAGIICGRTSLTNPIPFIGTKIVWWHGTKDTTLPYSSAVRFIDILKSAMCDAELISFVDAGHSIWGKAYPEYLVKFGIIRA